MTTTLELEGAALDLRTSKCCSVAARSTWHAQGILVCARVRPLSHAESLDPDVKSAVQCLPNDLVLKYASRNNGSGRFVGRSRARAPQDLRFPFHHVFHQLSSQHEVYMETTAPIVFGAFEGINGAVMAYGATGSGKTHSMFGSGISAPGVIFQGAHEMFAERERRLRQSPEAYIRMTCSFVEVYNEEVFDLLHPQGRGKPLQVQDVGEASTACVNAESFTLKGLTMHSPKDVSDFVAMVERGLHNRATAATNANAQSSRSHAIVTVEIEVKDREDSSKGTLARIRFCDLAGCERAAQLVSSNERLREGGKINGSLLELGRVMQALAAKYSSPVSVPTTTTTEGQATTKRAVPVPFIAWRGSKLLRLMRDCLDGNCRTALLICVSPTSDALDDTKNAVLFGMQAKKVQLTARTNTFAAGTPELAVEQARMIERQRLVITLLKDKLKEETGSCTVEGLDDEIAHEFGLVEYYTAVAAVPQPKQGILEAAARSSSGAWSGGGPSPIRGSAPSTTASEGGLSAATSDTSGATRVGSSSCSSATVQPDLPATPLKGPHPALMTTSSSSTAGNSTPVDAVASPSAIAAAADDIARELRTSLDALSQKKSDLQTHLRDANLAAKQAEHDIRKHVETLAEFVARSESFAALNGDANNPPPLRIVNTQNLLRHLYSQQSARLKDASKYDQELRSLDGEEQIIRNRLRQGKPSLQIELVLQCSNLRDSASAAEGIATQYHHEKKLMEERVEELKRVQERLVATICELMPLTQSESRERKNAAVALAFAEMSKSDKTKMLSDFETKLAKYHPSFMTSNKKSSAGVATSTGPLNQTMAPKSPSASHPSKLTRAAIAFTIAAGSASTANSPAASASSPSSTPPSFTVAEHSLTSHGAATAVDLTPNGSFHIAPAGKPPSAAAVASAPLGTLPSNATSASKIVSGALPFARTASTAFTLGVSPALMRRSNTLSGATVSHRDPFGGAAGSGSTAANTPTVPQKKPPVPFTTGEALAKAAAAEQLKSTLPPRQGPPPSATTQTIVGGKAK